MYLAGPPANASGLLVVACILKFLKIFLTDLLILNITSLSVRLSASKSSR